MQIIEYQMLDARNLLCCTAKFDPDSFAGTLKGINELLANNDISRHETTMHLSFDSVEPQMIQLHFALKKKMEHINEPCWIKDRVFLVQAVKARHEGELYELRNSFSQITKYMDMHKLSPITPFFCKVLAGLEDPENVQDMIADIYVGVNGNIF
jgi:hypothetical protein